MYCPFGTANMLSIGLYDFDSKIASDMTVRGERTQDFRGDKLILPAQLFLLVHVCAYNLGAPSSGHFHILFHQQSC